MKTKMTAATLLVLFLAVGAVTLAGAADPPTYDATGTWSYQNTNIWTDCVVPPDVSASGTAVISQTGSAFTMYSDGEIDTGTVSGNRYQIFESGSDGGGSGTSTRVWTLSSPTVASGYVTTTYVGGCSFMSDLYAEKQTLFGCISSDTLMCLRNGRYSVSVTWENQKGQAGVGHAVPFSDDSGLFWFFSDSNMELLIKVLNGCGFNSHYWVFFAATTDQEFTVTVTDLKTAQQVQYTNPLKNRADAVTDTTAFATCP
jgi:hypothetical protein